MPKDVFVSSSALKAENKVTVLHQSLSLGKHLCILSKMLKLPYKEQRKAVLLQYLHKCRDVLISP